MAEPLFKGKCDEVIIGNMTLTGRYSNNCREWLRQEMWSIYKTIYKKIYKYEK